MGEYAKFGFGDLNAVNGSGAIGGPLSDSFRERFAESAFLASNFVAYSFSPSSWLWAQAFKVRFNA